MAVQKTEAHLLRRIPFRETSWIFTCLTRSFGKLKGIVKGARKEKSLWLSSCELFTRANMIFFEKPKSNLHLITELAILDSHEKLRRNFSALAYAGYFAELVDQFLEENEPQPAIFELWGASASVLESRPTSAFAVLARAFETQLLGALGLLPRFLECMGCGARAESARRIYFNARQGGIYCAMCHEKACGGLLISRGCVQAIQFLSQSNIQKAAQLRLGRQISAELEQVIKQFMDYRLEHQLKSVKFLTAVKPILHQKNYVSIGK